MCWKIGLHSILSHMINVTPLGTLQGHNCPFLELRIEFDTNRAKTENKIFILV